MFLVIPNSKSNNFNSNIFFLGLLWKAPEILRNPCAHRQGTQKADVYSFAIILYEILGRRGPFGVTKYEPKGIKTIKLFYSLVF